VLRSGECDWASGSDSTNRRADALPGGFGECGVWGAAALLVAGTTRGGFAGAHAIASGLEAEDVVLRDGELALGVSHLAPVLGALSGGRVCESLVAV
jgi:hypothetical protein